jgi:hypothetical protein
LEDAARRDFENAGEQTLNARIRRRPRARPDDNIDERPLTRQRMRENEGD